MSASDPPDREVIAQENVRLAGEVRRLRREIDALRGPSTAGDAARKIAELEKSLADCTKALSWRLERGDGLEDPLAVESPPPVHPPVEMGLEMEQPQPERAAEDEEMAAVADDPEQGGRSPKDELRAGPRRNARPDRKSRERALRWVRTAALFLALAGVVLLLALSRPGVAVAVAVVVTIALVAMNFSTIARALARFSRRRS